MIAKWQAVGFCHGVMNTDNMSIIGSTIDYGPYGFLDQYIPNYVCNHSDVEGRYSYINQPYIGWWNLRALAYSLNALIKVEHLEQALAKYEEYFTDAYLSEMGKKLGDPNFTVEDLPILEELLKLLEKSLADWTIFWRKLSFFDEDDINSYSKIIDEITLKEECRIWLNSYASFLKSKNINKDDRQTLMQSSNPKYVPRNYLIQQAIAKAENDDFTEINTLYKIFSQPYQEMPEYETYASSPPNWAREIIVSCSS